MEKIIKKVNEGGYLDGKLIFNPRIGWGYMAEEEKPGPGEYVEGKKFVLPPAFVLHSPERMVLDPLFWQALGKACGWDEYDEYNHIADNDWLVHSLEFHKINLTQGFDKAVEYLTEIIK